jgi:hypothetical protein
MSTKHSLGAIREFLSRARHSEICPADNSIVNSACTCGLDDAWAAIINAERERHDNEKLLKRTNEYNTSLVREVAEVNAAHNKLLGDFEGLKHECNMLDASHERLKHALEHELRVTSNLQMLINDERALHAKHLEEAWKNGADSVKTLSPECVDAMSRDLDRTVEELKHEKLVNARISAALKRANQEALGSTVNNMTTKVVENTVIITPAVMDHIELTVKKMVSNAIDEERRNGGLL